MFTDFFAAAAKQFHGDPKKFLVIMDESRNLATSRWNVFGR